MNRVKNFLRVFQKEIQTKRLSFITQFKIEFLLLFFSYTKLLGERSDLEVNILKVSVKIF